MKSEPLSEFSGLDADFRLRFGCFGSRFSILTTNFDEFGSIFRSGCRFSIEFWMFWVGFLGFGDVLGHFGSV